MELLVFFRLTGGGWISVHEDITEQDNAKKELERTNMLLESALENMPHGVCMYGPDKKLVVANDLYSTMYGLSPEQAKPGATLESIVQARVAAGSSPVDVDKYISDRLKEAFIHQPGYILNELRDGRVISISRRGLPDGGSVAIHQDITAQKRAEEKIAHLAHYDALTGLTNRVLFQEHSCNFCWIAGVATISVIAFSNEACTLSGVPAGTNTPYQFSIVIS